MHPCRWKKASATGERRFWHEYFYEMILALDPGLYEGNPDECWLLAAARANLPIVVPGHEDSTFGNIFASYVKTGECSPLIVNAGIEYMAAFYDQYRVLSADQGVGFFQIGGGIAGDFPICVVPSIKEYLPGSREALAFLPNLLDDVVRLVLRRDTEREVTWDKLTEDTPMFA